MSLASIRKDLERGLLVRLKRVDNTTGKGNRTGSLPELEAAEKDVTRATNRLARAQAAHEATTAEVHEYAVALKNNGGEPNLPDWFSVYEAPADGDQESEDDDEDPDVNDDDDDAPDTLLVEDTSSSADEPQPRTGGRFARRGSQV